MTKTSGLLGLTRCCYLSFQKSILKDFQLEDFPSCLSTPDSGKLQMGFLENLGTLVKLGLLVSGIPTLRHVTNREGERENCGLSCVFLQWMCISDGGKLYNYIRWYSFWRYIILFWQYRNLIVVLVGCICTKTPVFFLHSLFSIFFLSREAICVLHNLFLCSRRLVSNMFGTSNRN